MQSIINSLKKFGHYALLPLQQFFYIFITLVLLHSLIDIAYFMLFKRYALSVFAHGLVIAYLFTIPCLWLKKHPLYKKVYLITLFTLYLISFCIDTVLHAAIGASLDEDLLSAFMATNASEASEAIQTYFSFTPLLIGGSFLLLIFLVYKFFKKRTPMKVTVYLSVLGILAGGAISLKMEKGMIGGFIGKIYLLATTEVPNDITLTDEFPKIETDKAYQPENLVLIMGESLSKTHCATYSYGKETTPRLQALEDQQLLFTFPNVTSADIRTISAFKTIYTTYRKAWGDSILWYECPTLHSMIHQSGYETYWISNQSKRGMCDNYIAKFAEQFDESFFAGNQLSGTKHDSFDEVLIDDVKPFLAKDADRKFYMIHLMGSHTLFDKRYPENFSHFKAEDYPDLPGNQQSIVAAYDNSVLYNDYVVDEIIKQFADKEALVFYFSDHAVDLFQSSPDFYGHAKNAKESFIWGQQIPFYIYASPKYQERFPETIEKIKKNLNNDFSTENFIYTLMDLIGTKFADNNDMETYTLFQK